MLLKDNQCIRTVPVNDEKKQIVVESCNSMVWISTIQDVNVVLAIPSFIACWM